MSSATLALAAERLAVLLTGGGGALSDPTGTDLVFEPDIAPRPLARAGGARRGVGGRRRPGAGGRRPLPAAGGHPGGPGAVPRRRVRRVRGRAPGPAGRLRRGAGGRRPTSASTIRLDAKIDLNLLRDREEWVAVEQCVAEAEPGALVLVDGDLRARLAHPVGVAGGAARAGRRAAGVTLAGVTKRSSLARGGAPLLGQLELEAEAALGPRSMWWTPVARTRPDVGRRHPGGGGPPRPRRPLRLPGRPAGRRRRRAASCPPWPACPTTPPSPATPIPSPSPTGWPPAPAGCGRRRGSRSRATSTGWACPTTSGSGPSPTATASWSGSRWPPPAIRRGRLFGKNVLEGVFRAGPDEDLFLGELLVAVDEATGRRYLFRIVDVTYGSEHREPGWAERVAGTLLADDDRGDDGAHRLYEQARRTYRVATCRCLGYLTPDGLEFRKPKSLPTQFSRVVAPEPADFAFLRTRMGDLPVGNLRSGETVVDFEVGIPGDSLATHVGHLRHHRHGQVQPDDGAGRRGDAGPGPLRAAAGRPPRRVPHPAGPPPVGRRAAAHLRRPLAAQHVHPAGRAGRAHRRRPAHRLRLEPAPGGGPVRAGAPLLAGPGRHRGAVVAARVLHGGGPARLPRRRAQLPGGAQHPPGGPPAGPAHRRAAVHRGRRPRVGRARPCCATCARARSCWST